eukprot:scaffold27956_cov129-Isochrysis_galbana.AAC.2
MEKTADATYANTNIHATHNTPDGPEEVGGKNRGCLRLEPAAAADELGRLARPCHCVNSG